MRIALLNCFDGYQYAESELAKRFERAAASAGLPLRQVRSVVEAERFKADCILAMHHWTGKVCSIPTYGCMWNPPEFFDHSPQHLAHVASYDGYLTSSPVIDTFVDQLLLHQPRRALRGNIYTSCPARPFVPARYAEARLCYLGTNWDGTRLGELFVQLSRSGLMDVYGPEQRWGHVRECHRGVLPFDGVSVIETLSRAGAGLCLHTAAHIATGTPSMRIFELAASGAVAICQRHPFIERHFGDCVLHFDAAAEPAEMARQVLEALATVRNKPDRAAEMARAAWEVFDRTFALERLLDELVRVHSAFWATPSPTACPMVTAEPPRAQYIVRCGSRPPAMLARALSSIAKQRQAHAEALIVPHQPIENLDQTAREAGLEGRYRMLDPPAGTSRSATLFAGLAAADAPLVGLLDDDDLLYPDHTAALAAALQRDPTAMMAHGGHVARAERPDLSDPPLAELPADRTQAPLAEQLADIASLAWFSPFCLSLVLNGHNCVASNSWLVRREALARIPLADPRLDLAEDFYLLLLLRRMGPFCFVPLVTSESRQRRGPNSDNSLHCEPKKTWEQAYRRIGVLLRGLEIAPGRCIEIGLPALEPATAPPATADEQIVSERRLSEALQAATGGRIFSLLRTVGLMGRVQRAVMAVQTVEPDQRGNMLRIAAGELRSSRAWHLLRLLGLWAPIDRQLGEAFGERAPHEPR